MQSSAESTLKSANRKPWLDALRALAMIFVVYGHMYNGSNEYFVFTSAVKIPLFFAVSGYLFSAKHSYADFFKKLFFRLLVPYFFLSLFPLRLVLSLIPSFPLDFKEELFRFVSGESLWYLPCCIIAEIIHFFIRKVSKAPYAVIIISAVSGFAGFVMLRFGVADFLFVNTAFIAQIFMLIGYIVRTFEDLLAKQSAKIIPVSAIIYLALAVTSLKLYPKECMDIHVGRYYNIPICLAMIVSGCICLFLVFMEIRSHLRFMTFIGCNTLVFYAFNGYMKGASLFAFSLIGFELPENLLTGLILTVIACIFCSFISVAVNKFLPEIAGKKRIRKS